MVKFKSRAVNVMLPLFSSLLQFLQDTLDTLFGILDESSQRYGLKVFDSLVSKLFEKDLFSYFMFPPSPKRNLIQWENRNTSRLSGERSSDVTLHSPLNQSHPGYAALLCSDRAGDRSLSLCPHQSHTDIWTNSPRSARRYQWWKGRASRRTHQVSLFVVRRSIRRVWQVDLSPVVRQIQCISQLGKHGVEPQFSAVVLFVIFDTCCFVSLGKYSRSYYLN